MFNSAVLPRSCLIPETNKGRVLLAKPDQVRIIPSMTLVFAMLYSVQKVGDMNADTLKPVIRAIADGSKNDLDRLAQKIVDGESRTGHRRLAESLQAILKQSMTVSIISLSQCAKRVPRTRPKNLIHSSDASS